jgi:hypothetical protein
MQAWHAANEFRATQGLPPLPDPRTRREMLPRWHPNIQALLRGQWERARAGVWACYCAECGREFYSRHPAGYCSPACSDAARHERERARRRQAKAGRACAHCLSSLPVTARTDSRYCSPACRQAAYRKRRGTNSPAVTAMCLVNEQPI